VTLSENRKQDRRDKPGSIISAIRGLLYKFGILVMHPAQKASEEHRDTIEERDRRNRRTRRDKARDDDRRDGSRRE
jgi:hypothetical protein